MYNSMKLHVEFSSFSAWALAYVDAFWAISSVAQSGQLITHIPMFILDPVRGFFVCIY